MTALRAAAAGRPAPAGALRAARRAPPAARGVRAALAGRDRRPHHRPHVAARRPVSCRWRAGEPSRDLIQPAPPGAARRAPHRPLPGATQRISVEVKNVPVQLEGASRRVDIVVRPVLRDDDPARGFFLVLFADHDGGDDARPGAAPGPVAGADRPAARGGAGPRQGAAADDDRAVRGAGRGSRRRRAKSSRRSTRSCARRPRSWRRARRSCSRSTKSSRTVNQELKIKIEELRLSNNDFQNLINSTDIATIFLDRTLRVKLTTPRARDLFNLLHTDVGRPLSDITSRLRYDQIDRDMHEVLGRAAAASIAKCRRSTAAGT